MKPLWIACLAFLLIAARGALAREEAGETVIREMAVSATMTGEGVLSVEETLMVFAGEGSSVDVTRGISGRFTRRGKNGTGFVLLSATLDGQPTKAAIRRSPKTLRLTLAARGAPLVPGIHVFKLRYELINMVSFQSEEDSLEWQLVRESSCPILDLSVDVRLPGPEGGASPRRLSGRMSGRRDGEGVRAEGVSLKTLTPLAAGDSFTLGLAWDKGFVAEKNPFLSPWRSWDLAVLGLLTAYYALTWSFWGRAPKRRTAELSTKPPEGLPPGLLRCVRDGGPSPRMLTAEILNLAVKGHIRLESTVERETREKEVSSRYSSLERMMDRRYRLHPNPGASLPPTPTEAVLLHNLFSPRSEVAPGFVQGYGGLPEVSRSWDSAFPSSTWNAGRWGYFFSKLTRPSSCFRPFPGPLGG